VYLFILPPKWPRPFFCQKSLKTASLVLFTPQKRKIYILESNLRILYFTCFKSCGKNFTKFDRTDWKILAFKVGKICFFLMLACNFKSLWQPFVELFCTTHFELKKKLCWKIELKVLELKKMLDFHSLKNCYEEVGPKLKEKLNR